MSQDDQNRDPQDQQGEDQGVDQPTRESRGTDSQPNQDPGTGTDQSSPVEDTDEMEEDRDDDEREDGKNRRSNIG